MFVTAANLTLQSMDLKAARAQLLGIQVHAMLLQFIVFAFTAHHTIRARSKMTWIAGLLVRLKMRDIKKRICASIQIKKSHPLATSLPTHSSDTPRITWNVYMRKSYTTWQVIVVT